MVMHWETGVRRKNLLREISNELRLNLFYDPEWNKEEADDTVLKEMAAKSVM